MGYLNYIVFVMELAIVGSYLMYFEFEMKIVVEYHKLVIQLEYLLSSEKVLDLVE